MDNAWVAFGKPSLYNARSVWWPYRRRMTGQLIALAQFSESTISPAAEATIAVATEAPTLVRIVTASPATATITTVTTAPAILDENTVAPADPAAILLVTTAPTITIVKIETVSPAAEATILVATEAPSLDYIYSATISPASEATITVEVSPPNVSTGEGTRLWPIFLNYTRRWVYQNEGYRPDVHYQRRYIVPMKPETRIPLSVGATISVLTEAPTLSVTVGTELIIQVLSPARIQAGGLFQPDPVFPFFTYTPPTLLRTSPNPAMIANSRSTGGRIMKIWRPPSRYVPGRVPTKRRPDHVTFIEQRQRGRRIVVFDLFNVGQRIITPAAATLQVVTETAVIGTGLGVGVTPISANIALRAQGPSILLDGATALAEEILLMVIAMRRRQSKVRWVTQRQRIPMQTRNLVGFAEPRPSSFIGPTRATIALVTAAPTVVLTNVQTVAPTEASITVVTEVVTISETALYQPEQTATLQVITEAPTLGLLQVKITPLRAATIVVSRGTPILTGINTVVFPGGNGTDTVEILVSTGAPVVYIQKWITENAASSSWTKETSASDGWDKVAAASSNWRK